MDSGSVEERSLELELVEAVAGSHSEEVLRASEEKYRILFEAVEQGLAIGEVILNGAGEGVDYRILETNAKFEHLTGLRPDAFLSGKTFRELIPIMDNGSLRMLGRVAVSGEPIRFETYAATLDRWFDVRAFRIGDPSLRRVASLYSDISSQQRTAQALRNSEKIQKFLLRLSDALRPLVDPIEIQGTASKILGEYLRANRIFYGEIDEEPSLLLVEREFVSEGTPSAIGPCPMEVFAWLRSSPQKFEPTVVNDVRTSPLLPEADRAALAALRAEAFIAVPLIKDGRLVACLCATDALPRDWTQDEVELVWHTGERTWAAVERAKAEAALRGSEGRYHTLFDSIDNAITVLEVLYDDSGVATDLRFVESNQLFEKQSGLTNHLGKTTSELLPNLEDSCIQHYASVAETGEPVRFESYSHDFERWISIFASRVGGEGSRLVNVVFYDITEQKQAEADLRESEERQAYLLKLSDALRPLANPSDVQGVASRLLGEQLQTDRVFYSKMDEAQGQLLVERDFVREGTPSLAGSYPLEAFAWIEQSTQKGEPTVIDNVLTSPLIPDASRAVILSTNVKAFTCVPLLKNDRRVAALCVADMEPRVWKPGEIELVKETAERTWAALERTRVEAELRQSEERLRLFLENVREYALVQLDRELRFTSWNSGAERIFGYSSEEALGKPFSLLLAPEDRETRIPCMKISSLESSGRNEDARWLVQKDGTRIWIRWVTEPIRNKDGQVIGLAKVLHDETERLKAETSLRQSEKLAVVGRMASSIAHEINNPLEAVTKVIYLARRGTVSPEVGEMLEQAERELARVSYIATATLSFHRQTTEQHVVDIEDILESVLVLHEGRLKSTQVTTERRYSCHPSISCQAVEVRQVIANLVGNAIDAMLKNTDARRLVVRVRKAADPATGEEGVRVMIADSGVGIQESMRKHLFEPFFTTKLATGTGLGLWLSSETVTKHRGTLRFRSRTDGNYRGTVFSLFLKA
jgi:PAS domain S-box-containing protein